MPTAAALVRADVTRPTQTPSWTTLEPSGGHPGPRAGEPDQPFARRLGVEALEAALAEEVVLVGLDRPAEPDLERIGFGVRVLSDEDVLLLQPEDPLRLQDRTDGSRAAPGRD
jgi:hypothetical protein